MGQRQMDGQLGGKQRLPFLAADESPIRTSPAAWTYYALTFTAKLEQFVEDNSGWSDRRKIISYFYMQSVLKEHNGIRYLD